MKAGQLIGLGVAGVGVWWLGDQFGWWGGSAPAATPATTPPPASSGIVPAGTPMPTTPAATVKLASAVTATVNNALKATFTINGQNQTISAIPGGDAYNNAGQSITAALAQIGVTPAQLYALMQAAYKAPATLPTGTVGPTPSTGGPSLGINTHHTLPIPARTPITRGMGVMVHTNRRNYVRRAV